MKKIIYTILISVLSFSCDVIKEEDYLIPTERSTVTQKRVLLEDYTGMRCVNCPLAAKIVMQLTQEYNHNIIPVSIHAGAYADPIQNKDLRCADGVAYYEYFNKNHGMELFPSGVFDRTKYNGSMVSSDYKVWRTIFMEKAAQETPVEVNLTCTYDATKRSVKITTDVELLDDVAGQIALQLWILEDKIIAPQMLPEEMITDKPYDLEYEHRHVLRGAVNGTWGAVLFNPGSGTDGTKGTHYLQDNTFVIPEGWNESNCIIIGFVYKTQDLSVLQANETPIIKKYN